MPTLFVCFGIEIPIFLASTSFYLFFESIYVNVSIRSVFIAHLKIMVSTLIFYSIYAIRYNGRKSFHMLCYLYLCHVVNVIIFRLLS